MTVPLVLPLPPNRNQGSRSSGWAWRKAKSQWNDAADLTALRRGFPRPPRTPWEKIAVSAILIMPVEMDDDNAFYRASKCPMDWLKTRRYIVDDSRKHVTWVALPEQVITRKDKPRLELTLRVLEAA